MNRVVRRVIFLPNCRTFKNFGHKREPIPTVTTLWHGFLTFTFIGCGIEWKRIIRFYSGEEEPEPMEPWAVRTARRKAQNEGETEGETTSAKIS